jgi:tRNA A-37 threonylcarbamoyl transferase component Bud32
MADHLNKKKHQKRTGSKVQIVDNRVIKIQDPILAELEFIKTKQAASIAASSSLFRVPEIISFDLSKGEIVFERLYGLKNLIEALFYHRDPFCLLEKVGLALAIIHNKFFLPEKFSSPLPTLGIEIETNPVYVHGDFSWENVMFHPERDELVVIDWAIAPWLDRRGSFGPCFLDLGILMQGLFIRRPGAPYRLSGPELLGRTFLQSYSSAFSQEFRISEFRKYFSALFSIYLKMRRRQIGNVRYLAYLPSFLRLKAFVRTLELSDS